MSCGSRISRTHAYAGARRVSLLGRANASSPAQVACGSRIEKRLHPIVYRAASQGMTRLAIRPAALTALELHLGK